MCIYTFVFVYCIFPTSSYTCTRGHLRKRVPHACMRMRARIAGAAAHNDHAAANTGRARQPRGALKAESGANPLHV